MYEAQKRYDKKNTKSFSLKLNYNTDADMIAYLEAQINVQGFLKNLINERMYWNTDHLMTEEETNED